MIISDTKMLKNTKLKMSSFFCKFKSGGYLSKLKQIVFSIIEIVMTHVNGPLVHILSNNNEVLSQQVGVYI